MANNFKFHGFPAGTDVVVQFDQNAKSKSTRSQHYGEDAATYIARKKAEMDPMPDHGGDVSKHDEHMAAMAIVPKSGMSNVAVIDGNWSDANIWSLGHVPGATGPTEKALIPSDVIVTVDGVFNDPFYVLRVDGTLIWSRTANTRLVVDTVLAAYGSVWDQGTEASPIPSPYRSEIFVYDSGDIDVSMDADLQSRGIMLHGRVDIHGQDKVTWLRCTTMPTTGATSVTLDSVPTGWEVGDMIVIPGTVYSGVGWNGSNTGWLGDRQDEVRTITSIVGNTVSWDASQPLVHARTKARVDLNLAVMNMTRNILFKSQNEGATPFHRRGHFMAMHTDIVDIQYLETAWIGRTRKGLNPDGTRKPWGNPTAPGIYYDYNLSNSPAKFRVWAGMNPLPPTANVQGRYGIHLHRSGVKSRALPMAKVWGCSVRHSPGWGIVHHDSHASIRDCTVFDIFGAGIVGEKGTETGEWVGNAVCGLDGIAAGPSKNFNIKGSYTYDPTKPFEDDMGRTGDAYWFQGRLIKAEGNVAGSCNTGFNYSHRTGTGTPSEKARINMDTYEADPGLGLGGSLGWADQTSNVVRIAIPQILHFKNNEAFACNVGAHVEKEGPAIGHEIHTVIGDSKMWNAKLGVQLGYTGHYIVRGFDIVNAERAFEFGLNMIGMVVTDNIMTDCVTGFDFIRGSTQAWTKGELGFLKVNNTFINCTTPQNYNNLFWLYDTPTAQSTFDVENNSYTPGAVTPKLNITGPFTWASTADPFPNISGGRIDSATAILADANFNVFPLHPDPTGLPETGRNPMQARGYAPDAPYLFRSPFGESGAVIAGVLERIGYWHDSTAARWYTLIPIYWSDRLNGKIYLHTVIGETATQTNFSNYANSTLRGTLTKSAFAASIPAEVTAAFNGITPVVNDSVFVWDPAA